MAIIHVNDDVDSSLKPIANRYSGLYSTVYKAIAGTPVSALQYPQFRSSAPCCGVEAETDTNQDTERRVL